MDTTTKRRRLSRIHLPLIFILSLAAATSQVSAAEEITGEWEVKMVRGDFESFATLSISKKPDGTYTGKWGRTELSNVKFDGQKLTFVRTQSFRDQDFSTDFSGTLKDGKITGTLSNDFADTPATAVRKKPKNPALGRWDIDFTVNDRDVTATLTVSEEKAGILKANWTSSAGEHEVSDVKFNDGKLSFARKSKFDNFELESTYEGKIDGNKLAGTIKSEMGDITATGRRVGAELVGAWELTSDSDRGPRTNLLTVFGDLSARYEFFGGEIPVKLKLEGDQVSFHLEMAFGGNPFNMDFKGKLDGDTLKGNLETPRGSREVTGKKLSPEKPVSPEKPEKGEATKEKKEGDG